ncbi:MAG: hypothetical protein LBS75_00745 [Synergistaceae bacterium]|jgi:tetratricopeptide (TPR) repeat protein|nr:hypothetical protein [Synergistaceae bacterium]
MDDMNLQKISELIKQVIGEDDDERRGVLADEIMEIDPDNPLAKYIKWQSLNEDPLRGINLLHDAVALLRPQIEVSDDSDEVDERVYSLYMSMLSDLASFLYFGGRKDDALETARELMELDRDCRGASRMIYYTVLVERKDFTAVMDSADSDICQTPMGEFCRAIAMFETDGGSRDSLGALLDAFEADPDLPFYVLELWEIDDSDIDGDEDEDAYIEEMLMTASMLTDLWSETDERLAFITAVTFAFGYLTGRVLDPNDMDMIEETYKGIGCLDKMRETRDVLRAKMASGSDQEEIDEEAITALRDAESLGLFGFSE